MKNAIHLENFTNLLEIKFVKNFVYLRKLYIILFNFLFWMIILIIIKRGQRKASYYNQLNVQLNKKEKTFNIYLNAWHTTYPSLLYMKIENINNCLFNKSIKSSPPHLWASIGNPSSLYTSVSICYSLVDCIAFTI